MPQPRARQPLGLPPRHVDQGAHGRSAPATHQRPARVGADAAVDQHDDPVGEQQRLGHVVGDHQVVRPSAVVQGAVGAAERVAGDRIERAERLVHQHQLRLGRQRAGDADPLRWPPESSRG
jgi:hypothetical protein